MKISIVKDNSYAFALRSISLARKLRGQRGYDLASQVLRAGTSIGANVEEALAGVSRPDFVAKMAIASKEALETQYCLRLLRYSKTVATEQIESMVEEVGELVRILTAIVKTSQERKEPRVKN